MNKRNKVVKIKNYQRMTFKIYDMKLKRKNTLHIGC